MQSSGVAKGGGAGGHGPQSRKQCRIVGNGGGGGRCLIHRVTKYSGFQDACVRFVSQSFRFATKIRIQIGLS